MNLSEATKFLTQQVPDPSQGLPDEVFYYISSVTPLVNVDLLIKDEKGRTLLTWRDDPFCGTGWHIPGGIIRFKETMAQRIIKVAQGEIGVENIEYDQTPINLHEFIHEEQEIRSHFISFLFRCFLPSSYKLDNKEKKPGDVGYMQWHDKCPDNLIEFHEVYLKFI